MAGVGGEAGFSEEAPPEWGSEGWRRAVSSTGTKGMARPGTFQKGLEPGLVSVSGRSPYELLASFGRQRRVVQRSQAGQGQMWVTRRTPAACCQLGMRLGAGRTIWKLIQQAASAQSVVALLLHPASHLFHSFRNLLQQFFGLCSVCNFSFFGGFFPLAHKIPFTFCCDSSLLLPCFWLTWHSPL